MIRDLEEKDIEEVAYLERKSYPDFFCLGYQDFLDDFKKYKSFSMVGIINEEVKAYIYAYEIKKQIYISDFCCQHTSLLLPLWNSFCLKNSGKTCRAELREVSYQLIRKLEKWITILTLEIKKNYYGIEDAYFIVFKIKQDFGWKERIQHSVYYKNDLEFLNEEGSDLSFYKRILLKREKLK